MARGEAFAASVADQRCRPRRRRRAQVRKKSNPHGVPTWSHNGPICTGETYKAVVKLTFFKGASLAIQRDSSTRAWTAIHGAPSTSANPTMSMNQG